MTERGAVVPGGPPALVRVPPLADHRVLVALLRQAGLPIGRPVVVLVGGADGLTQSEQEACESIFRTALVPALEEAGAVLVDGGTNSGIMRLAGRARHRVRAQSPHVGVVAAGTVRWTCGPPPAHSRDPATTQSEGTAELEPHHSNIIVVPGDRWGDESRWINAVTAALSADQASVTLLANGGDIAYSDVRHSIADGRRVLVLGGTGRAAAQLADAVARRPADHRAVALARSPLLTVLPDDPNAVRLALAGALGGRPPF